MSTTTRTALLPRLLPALFVVAALPLAGAESFLFADPLAGLDKARANNCDKSLVAAPERGGQALRLGVTAKPAEGWMSHVYVYGLEEGVHTGDKITISLWARVVEGSEGAIKVEVGQAEKPFTSVITKFVMPTKEWTMYSLDGVAKQDLPANKVRFGFCVGYREQVVEIAGIEIKNLGQ